MPLTNWAGNYRYRAAAVHRPRTLDELRRVVSGPGTFGVVNTRHSFNAIADADALVLLDQLPEADAVEIDPGAMTVTVGATVTYAQLAARLEAAGLALQNMASLPHVSVAGAIATATHGSGDGNGNLSTAVRGLQIVTSEGEIVDLDAADPRLPGAAVHLGALGVVTGVTLSVQPSFVLRQDVYLGMEWGTLAANLDAVTSAGHSVSLFHDFGERIRELWVKRDPDAASVAGEQFLGALPAPAPRHPVLGWDPVNCTPQLGVPGPWHERLPHFLAGFTPSAGDEIQSEWFVAREHAIAALAALRELSGSIQPLLLVSEMRTIAADELWMSPHYQRPSVAIHFTWRREAQAVAAVGARVEQALAPFSPRAHPGKVFSSRAADAAAVPRLADFLALQAELDPRGAFLNRFLREQLFRDSAATA